MNLHQHDSTIQVWYKLSKLVFFFTITPLWKLYKNCLIKSAKIDKMPGYICAILIRIIHYHNRWVSFIYVRCLYQYQVIKIIVTQPTMGIFNKIYCTETVRYLLLVPILLLHHALPTHGNKEGSISYNELGFQFRRYMCCIYWSLICNIYFCPWIVAFDTRKFAQNGKYHADGNLKCTLMK